MDATGSLDSTLACIHHQDCIAGMNALPTGSVDLAFADPPFNIGYDYDVYHDSKDHQHYLDWSRGGIAAVHRVLKPNGTFWLAIGDEYAATVYRRTLNFKRQLHGMAEAAHVDHVAGAITWTYQSKGTVAQSVYDVD